MKKIFFSVSIATLLISCGEENQKFNNQLTTKSDSLSYALGTTIVSSLKSSNINDIQLNVFMAAMQKGMDGDSNTLMTTADAQNFIQTYMRKMQEKKISEQFGEHKQKNIDFLEKNKNKEGVTTTPSGLQYEIVKMGTGNKPVATDKVTVHYKGTLIDGTSFDSSYDRKEPLSLELNKVIPGWTEGVQLMPIGSKFIFYIPSELGYGANQNNPNIPPYSTLIFEIELLNIEK